MTEPVKLISAKTDAQAAADIRLRLLGPLEECCLVMAEAREMGLTLNFNITTDQYNRFVSTVNIVKAL